MIAQPLDKFFQLIVKIWRALIPFHICYEYQAGFVMRLGRKVRSLKPGKLNWLWPILEHASYDSVVLDTTHLLTQSLTTKDKVPINLTLELTHEVADIETLLLKVEGKEQVVKDSAYGVVSEMVLDHTWEEILQKGFRRKLLRDIAKDALRFGVRILAVNIVDLQHCKSLRLWTTVPEKPVESGYEEK